MATMARSILAPKPLSLSLSLSPSSTSRISPCHLPSQISLPLPPLNAAPSTTTSLTLTPQSHRGGGRPLLAFLPTDASTPTFPNQPHSNNTGTDPPTVVNSSGLSIQFPGIPSSWNTLLIGAAVFLSVPLYRRIKKAEEAIEKAEEAAETAIEAIDKAAEEVGHVASDLAKSSSNGAIREIALKVEGLAGRIEKDAEMAEEILHKVEHITEEVEELLEPLVEKGEAKDKERKADNGHDKKAPHKSQTSINNSEANNSDL